MTIARSVRLSSKGQLVIPKEMREALGVKEGDDVLLVQDGGRMVITTPKEFARVTRGSLKGSWGRSRRDIDEYLEGERRAWP